MIVKLEACVILKNISKTFTKQYTECKVCDRKKKDFIVTKRRKIKYQVNGRFFTENKKK